MTAEDGLSFCVKWDRSVSIGATTSRVRFILQVGWNPRARVPEGPETFRLTRFPRSIGNMLVCGPYPAGIEHETMRPEIMP